MVDATVAFALQKLSDFLDQEVNIRIGVKDGVRWLKDEMGYLQSIVKDVESKQDMDHLIHQWINNVKEVANDTVSILDRYSALQEGHVAPKQGVLHGLLSSIFMCKKEANLYDIGKEIESLKGRILEIKNRRKEYGISNILSTLQMQRRKRTLLRATSFENKVDVVGLEDDFRTLLAELVRDDPSLGMISIHGMGGLGKTTLASKLYHSSELNHFEIRAWVCVSQEYNIKEILKTIIKSFMGPQLDLQSMEEVDLMHHLRKLLQDRDRYLVVIDDLWNVEAWEMIKKAFPDKKNGSKVIITTRNKRVAQKVDDRCFVHELRFLREDESWQLFCRRANPTGNLENLGRDMASKCQGLPLAIVVLSGLLLHKKSYEDWSKVKNQFWRHLKGDSVEIQEILSLSYDDLSFQLRQCFIYLARFPEDCTFAVDKLKLLWIAEEFISEADEGNGVSLEDVCEDYLNELINRNMIQIATVELDGQVAECRVHDLVHDLVIQKAMEHKLMGIIDSSKQHSSHVSSLHGQQRHAIYKGIGEYLKLFQPCPDDLKLRSLALINETHRLNLEEIRSMYTRFKYLKVLDLTRVKSDGIPEEIGGLVLLKFLGLMGSHSISKPLVIPASIGKLKKLQTLCGSFSCQYVFPREIRELKELRHLKISRTVGGWNIGSHQTKLQTLITIWFEKWVQIDTVNFTSLHTLFIRNNSINRNGYTLDSISNLKSLQKFILLFGTVIPTIKPLSFCKRLKTVFLLGTINDPSELSFLPDSVTSLTLFGSEFTQDPMPTLGSLSNLIALESYNLYMGEKMVCNSDAFPSLQFLKLEYLPNLEEWQVEDGALSSLISSQISQCENLKMVPQIVKCVPPTPLMFKFRSLLTSISCY